MADETVPIVALSLDEIGRFTVGAKVFLKGPLLLLEVVGDGTALVYDGHPANAESTCVAELRADTITAGGTWVGTAGYVIAVVETVVRAGLPVPFVLRLTRDALRNDHSTDSIVRVLERFGADIVEARGATSTPDFVATVSIPVSNFERATEYLDQVGVTAVPIGGQGFPAERQPWTN